TRQPRQLILMAFWTTWQFYCSLYTGYFLALVLVTLAFGQVLCHRCSPIAGVRALACGISAVWARASAAARMGLVIGLGGPAGLIVLLCMPYIEASHLYGFERQWSETVTMLPRPESYLLASNSRLWPQLAGSFLTLPMRQEHVMFIGAAPLLAIAIAVTLCL